MTKDKIIRASKKFDAEMRKISLDRFTLKIDPDKRPRSNPELTEMMLNCPSFIRVKEELISIPRQRDLDKLMREGKI